MTLKPNGIRSLVSLYMGLKVEGREAVGTGILSLKAYIEDICRDRIKYGKTTCWAAGLVGPVLAAGLSVGGNLNSMQSAISFWRVAGLLNQRSYSPADAVKLLSQCGITAFGGLVNQDQLELAAKLSGRHLTRLPEEATFADMVYWLSRRTYSPFLRSVALECAEVLSAAEGEYGFSYTQHLVGLEEKNSKGLLSSHAESSMKMLWIFDVNEIQCLLKGNTPHSSLKIMAKHELARQFLGDYYERATKSRKAKVSS